MKLLALGGNLPSETFGAPAATIAGALGLLQEAGLTVTAVSALYETAPVPVSDQPWYINAVARFETLLSPARLLATLLDLETRLGRRRSSTNAARILDLDILDYEGIVTWAGPVGRNEPILPHPRLDGRLFVLRPLADVAPGWRHPVTGLTVEEMLAALPAGQQIRRLA